MDSQLDFLTFGLAAVKLGGGVQHHHLDRLALRGAIPYRRAGRIRLISLSDLEAVRAVCAKAGYFVAPSPEAVHA